MQRARSQSSRQRSDTENMPSRLAMNMIFSGVICALRFSSNTRL